MQNKEQQKPARHLFVEYGMEIVSYDRDQINVDEYEQAILKRGLLKSTHEEKIKKNKLF